jgi:hypothetical protein
MFDAVHDATYDATENENDGPANYYEWPHIHHT